MSSSCNQPETTETAPEAKEVPAASTGDEKEAVPAAAEAAKPAADGDNSRGTADVAPAADAAANGGTAADSSNSNSGSSSSSGGGLFGSVLKGAPAFVSPFGSLVSSKMLFLAIGDAAGVAFAAAMNATTSAPVSAFATGCGRQLLPAAFRGLLSFRGPPWGPLWGLCCRGGGCGRPAS